VKIPRAIIVGSNGQDGRLLFNLLQKQGYTIIGISKDSIHSNQQKFNFDPLDISDLKSVRSVVKTFQPDEIYYLPAFHHSSEDQNVETRSLWENSYKIHVQGLLNFLECIRCDLLHSRLFYAASSHIFGTPPNDKQDENTPINPDNIYGITKATGVFLCRFYRSTHRIFCSVGILYNHESILRTSQFISKKIVQSAVKIKQFGQGLLIVGNLSAIGDWGYAPDYVRAMKQILALPDPDDFVIATGAAHTVQEFVELVFRELGLDWKLYVTERRDILTRLSPLLVGDATKLRSLTGWTPIRFNEMIRNLVNETTAEQRRELL
jgi:GDPmannose 4,6-dehydratase